MYRSHHPAFSLQNCITMQNRLPLTFVPKHYTTYFINSKRRFFLYFKYKDEMKQVIKILQRENVRFYPRKSIFPDRQQQEQIVFHCNYKYKKKDLRWALHKETPLREPINRFYERESRLQISASKQSKPYSIEREKNQPISINNQHLSSQSNNKQKELPQIQMEQTAPQYVADFGQIKIKNPEVLAIINNLELIKALFKSQKKK